MPIRRVGKQAKNNDLDAVVKEFIVDVTSSKGVNTDDILEEALHRNIASDPRVQLMINQYQRKNESIDKANAETRKKDALNRWEQMANAEETTPQAGPVETGEGPEALQSYKMTYQKAPKYDYAKLYNEAARVGIQDDPMVKARLERMKNQEQGKIYGEPNQTSTGYIGQTMQKGFPVSETQAIGALPAPGEREALSQKMDIQKTQAELEAEKTKAETAKVLLDAKTKMKELKNPDDKDFDKAHEYVRNAISMTNSIGGQIKDAQAEKATLTKQGASSQDPRIRQIDERIGKLNADMEVYKALEKTARTKMSSLAKEGGTPQRKVEWEATRKSVILPKVKEYLDMKDRQIQLLKSKAGNFTKEMEDAYVQDFLQTNRIGEEYDPVVREEMQAELNRRIGGGGNIAATASDEQLKQKLREKGIPEERLDDALAELKKRILSGAQAPPTPVKQVTMEEEFGSQM